MITSPNYPQRDRITRDCVWHVIVEPRKRVNLTVIDYDVAEYDYDYYFYSCSNSDDKLEVSNLGIELRELRKSLQTIT